MVKRVKQVIQDVGNQRIEMDRTGTKQFSDNTEIGELKRELLKVTISNTKLYEDITF